MVLRISCSVGGLTFSRNFFKPFVPRHIWRKIQLESDSLPYNQLIFLFSYQFFFYNWTERQSPKDQQIFQSRLRSILRSRLPGYFPTSFSSRGLQGPHHHHLYHHHHVRRDGPSDQPTRYHHHQSLQDELRTAPSRELKTSTALPPSIKTRLEYLSAPNPSAAFLPRGGVDSFTHPKLKGTDFSGKSSATEINRPGTILVRGVVSRKNQRTDHRRTAIDPPCKYS